MRRSKFRVASIFGALLLSSALVPAHAQVSQWDVLLNDRSFGFDPIEGIAGQWVGSAIDDLRNLCANGGCNTPGTQALINNLFDMDDAAFQILNPDFFSEFSENFAVGPAFGGNMQAMSSSRILSQSAALTPQQNAVVKLRDALRACAPEEFASQRAVNTEFTNNQMAAVGGRITALRFGAQGFSVAGMQLIPHDAPRGGAASADGEAMTQRWGGFLNTAYGWGERDTSPYETGFDFDGVDITLGADYRFTSQFVAGATVGYFDQTVDFTPIASQSRGDIESKGFNVNLFALYEWDGPYVSGSLGYQQLTHDSERLVKYQLFDTFGNPLGAPVDETETGETDSSALVFSADFGWPLRAGGFGYEPYIRAEYRDMTIDAFQETSVNNIGGGVGAFGVSVPERDVKSVLGAAGVKAQYVFTPSFGVIVPFVSAEYRNEFEDEALSARVTYTSAAAVPGVASSFNAPGDEPDTSYAIASIGTTAVFQGGWQAFVQYRRVFALEYVTHQTVTLGVRGEF